MSDRYNGYTNYETYLVSLWLSNNESSYHYWKEQGETASPSALADAMEDEFTQAAETDLDDSFALLDLLKAALGRVNWFEVAEQYLPDGGWKE
jgi:hypothetical protein